MNANELERLLLLEQSGELSPRQRRALDAALGASAEARQLRGQLRALAAAVPPPAAAPAPDTAARIAARLQPKPKPAFVFQPAWKSALAAAAVLALLLGVRTFNPTRVVPAGSATLSAETEEWTDPLESEFAELEAFVSSISEESLEITEL